MAALDPALVLELVAAIPDTDNVRVHEGYEQAALSMPRPLAARLAEREIRWLTKQDRLSFLLPDYLGQLVVHLVASQEFNVAVKLARVLLELRKDAERDRYEAHFDDWTY